MGPFPRTPTPAQIEQERSLALVIYLDLLIVVPYLLVGLATGALAMVAEVIRGGLLMSVLVLSLQTLRKAHRGLAGQYEFGTGKLERALSMAVALLLLVAAGFIFWKALFSHPAPPQSSWLGIAAVALTFLNLCVNSAPLIPMWRAIRKEPSVIVLSHFKARFAKALGSVVVVATVAIYMFASDPRTARIAEAVGSMVVVGFMVVVSINMIRESLPDLVDRALEEPLQLHINRTLATFFDNYDELIAVRSRNSGNLAHIEITLGFAPEKTIGELTDVLQRMTKHLQEAIPNSDIVIVPRTTKPGAVL